MEDKFARLLTEGVHRIRLREAKTIQAIQDELGYAVGREGGSSIEYWRKGHLPPDLATVETLAKEIIRRGRLGWDWLEQFLESAKHPYPEQFSYELLPAINAGKAEPVMDDSKRVEANPFIVGPPIHQPHQFFGRDYELRRIFALWKQFPLQNVAIIGPKRSGKTSLLHYLEKITVTPADQLRPTQRVDWLPQPDHYRWIYVDFQDIRMCNRERLLRYILTSLDIPIPERCDLENFMDVVSLHLQTPTIILLDEISAALASPELDQQFWGSLRSLGCKLTGGNLAFLLASHELPAQLAQEQGKPSPFFNIFGHTFKLGPLKETEALEIIASSPRPFDPTDINWMITQSGCWPYLLQILCHTRLSALEDNEASDGWKQEAIRQMAPYWYLLS